MSIIYSIIGVLLYLFIGGVIAGIIHDEDFDFAAIFFWPLLVVFFLAILIVDALKGLGYTLANIFSHFIRGGDEQ
jgi:hypothetical protein